MHDTILVGNVISKNEFSFEFKGGTTFRLRIILTLGYTIQKTFNPVIKSIQHPREFEIDPIERLMAFNEHDI